MKTLKGLLVLFLALGLLLITTLLIPQMLSAPSLELNVGAVVLLVLSLVAAVKWFPKLILWVLK
ncbi:hypothetical protein FDJ32_gp10 [Pseudomonas phage NV1]|uniref:Uncharacterized protein n=1 Tax=Pseudomonas phage NV1 TaxID=2079543 RepID=A0A2L0HPK4_9CAUD|nr:hypothetical protein FDJ32_gp10 [Pseudomonas phage NV1]AUX83639.1 hypothetical protein NV1_p10 [Pseudomonas phage NV1]